MSTSILTANLVTWLLQELHLSFGSLKTSMLTSWGRTTQSYWSNLCMMCISQGSLLYNPMEIEERESLISSTSIMNSKELSFVVMVSTVVHQDEEWFWWRLSCKKVRMVVGKSWYLKLVLLYFVDIQSEYWTTWHGLVITLSWSQIWYFTFLPWFKLRKSQHKRSKFNFSFVLNKKN